MKKIQNLRKALLDQDSVGIACDYAKDKYDLKEINKNTKKLVAFYNPDILEKGLENLQKYLPYVKIGSKEIKFERKPLLTVLEFLGFIEPWQYIYACHGISLFTKEEILEAVGYVNENYKGYRESAVVVLTDSIPEKFIKIILQNSPDIKPYSFKEIKGKNMNLICPEIYVSKIFEYLGLKYASYCITLNLYGSVC